jgi:Spy/CpxP family protein refolding chaperone
MKHGALAALMIAVVAGGLALAQPGPATAVPAPAAKAQAPMACGMQGMQGMMPGAAMPDMTPEQLEKIDALRAAHLKEMSPLRTDLQIKELELGALWRADEPDAKKIVAKVKEIGDIREKMEIARINHQFDMRKLMTPEQRKAMKGMGMGRGMMGKGMGRGRRGMMRGQTGGCPMGGEGCGMQGGGQCGMQGPMKGQGGQQGCPDCKMK